MIAMSSNDAGTDASTATPDPVLVVSDDSAEIATGEDTERNETIEHPAKVMRIGSMIKQLLEEVRQVEVDEAGRNRLAEIYEQSVKELAEGLSDDLRDELA